MGTQFVTALVTQADQFARRLRQWNERTVAQQVAQQVEAQKRTIDVRVVQEAKSKAIELLKTSKEWVDSEQQRLQLLERKGEEARRWLSWLMGIVRRSANSWIFFILWSVTVAGWGWVGGINTPPILICQSQQDLCYRMRFRGVKRALANMPALECTKTRKGLMCLIEPASKTYKQNPTKN
jgi:hypothetical protein